MPKSSKKKVFQHMKILDKCTPFEGVHLSIPAWINVPPPRGVHLSKVFFQKKTNIFSETLDKCTPPGGGTFIQAGPGQEWINVLPPRGIHLSKVFKKVLQMKTFFIIHIPHSASHMLLHTCCCMWPVQKTQPPHTSCAKYPAPHVIISLKLLATLLAKIS